MQHRRGLTVMEKYSMEKLGFGTRLAERRCKKIEKSFAKAMAAMGKDDNKVYDRDMGKVVAELMENKLLPLSIDKLGANLKDIISRIRTNERTILDIYLKESSMPRKIFNAGINH